MQEISYLVAQYGLIIVFFNVLLEQLGLPIPAIPTLIFAGVLAANGQLSLAAVFLLALLACLIGDGAWYMAGRRYGNRVMKMLCRISLSPDSCVRQSEAQFQRWGVGILLFAKFIPGLSTIAPPLAGALKLGWLRFLFYNGIGAALWAGLGIGIGLLFHKQIDQVIARLETMGSLAVIILLFLLAIYIAIKWWERRRFYKMLRMARITVDELYHLMHDGKEPVIADVRSAGARSLDPRRIPSAVVLEMDSLDDHLQELPNDREIILYCTCPNEATAARVAKMLIDRGYVKVRPLEGGLDAWVAAGYEAESVAR